MIKAVCTSELVYLIEPTASLLRYTVGSKQMFNINIFLPMTGIEPRTSGIISDCSTNWASTTAQTASLLFRVLVLTKTDFKQVPILKIPTDQISTPSTFYRKVCLVQCDQIGRFFFTLGNFLKPLETIYLPKCCTFLDNFCKGVKIYHF